MGSDETTTTARRPVAVGPGPQTEALRAAYLDLLKLCLCDLAGASTSEVRWTGDKRWFTRQLTDDDQIASRAEGKDLTLNGLSMIGLRRLDDLQACVESIVADEIGGDVIEAGVWRGGASILMRATLDSLGAVDRALWMADSFEGFPRPGENDIAADRALEADLSGIELYAPGLGTVQSYFARFGLENGLRFVPGFFENTLRHLSGLRWSLIRIDADTYKATKLALEALYPGLTAGGYVVLDDYFHPWLPECRNAVDDFRAAQGITEPIHQIDWNGGRWRREAEPEALGQSDAAGLEGVIARSAATVKPPPRIPTDRELQLTAELDHTRARAQALAAQVESITSSPVEALRAWWRQRRHSAPN